MQNGIIIVRWCYITNFLYKKILYKMQALSSAILIKVKTINMFVHTKVAQILWLYTCSYIIPNFNSFCIMTSYMRDHESWCNIVTTLTLYMIINYIVNSHVKTMPYHLNAHKMHAKIGIIPHWIERSNRMLKITPVSLQGSKTNMFVFYVIKNLPNVSAHLQMNT